MSLLTMHLQDLNPHIMCVLCGGYLVDATTIVECLHSFCRSCIVKYLQTSYHCPVCDAEVHKTKPLLHIRPDRTLQDIVYKIVPGIYNEEVNRRKEFEASKKEKNEPAIEGTADEDTASNEKDKDPLPFDDPVCITLEYFRKTRNRMEKEVFPTRYLRCSSDVTVKVLKKFLVMKFAIPETHNTEITRSDEILDGHLTMKEVCRIYGLYSKPFVDLQYVFLEKKDATTSVEKPNILDVKRKRIKKKKKGNKSLLKKCLGANTPHRLKNKTGKKKDSSSTQPSENAQKLDMEPNQPRPFENEKKENLVLSPIHLCANVKKEDLVSSKEPTCDKVEYDNNVKEPSLPAQSYHNCDKARDSLLQPNMDNQNGGNVNENEADLLGKTTVRRFNQHDLAETLLNPNLIGVDSSSTVTPMSFPEPARFWPAMNGESGEEIAITPAVNDLKHAQSDDSYHAKEVEMDTSISNYTNDICMNHISTDLESSAAMLHGLGMLLGTL